MTAIARWLVLVVVCLGLHAPACAHLMPNSVISLDFHRSRVEAEILMPMSELAYASGHRLDASPTRGIEQERGFIAGYVRDHLRLTAPDGRAWLITVGETDVRADSWNTDIRCLVTLTPPAGQSARRFALSWNGIIDRVSNHFVLVFVRNDFALGTMASAPEMLGGLQGSAQRLVVNRGNGSGWLGFVASLRLGMEHIAQGHDHLLFLMALVLPAPLLARRGRWAEFGGWRKTLGSLAMIVTAFTLGHSLTLIGGALFDWQLPARPVEVGIAVSILVSALHAWRPIFAGREAVVAASFGLVHGLAFASVISNFRLDPMARAASILGFNLGIEVVQLAVIVSVLPLLLMVAPTRSYPAIRTCGAVFAGFAALAWIEERLTGHANGIGDALDTLLGKTPCILAAATIIAALRHYASRRMPAER